MVHRSLGRRRAGRLLATTPTAAAPATTTPGAGALHAASPRARRMVLAAVDHELRTPLTNVIGFVELLLDGEAGRLTEEQAAMLQRIDANAERLLAMVTTLLGGCSTGLREGQVVDLAGAVVEALGGMETLCARMRATGR